MSKRLLNSPCVSSMPRTPRWDLDPGDRAFWVSLSKIWSGWREVLVIVQPDTVIRWHRTGFRLYWRFISKRGPGRPPIPIASLQVYPSTSSPTAPGSRSSARASGQSSSTKAAASALGRNSISVSIDLAQLSPRFEPTGMLTIRTPPSTEKDRNQIEATGPSRSNSRTSSRGWTSPVEEGIPVSPAGPRGEHLLQIQVDHR